MEGPYTCTKIASGQQATVQKANIVVINQAYAQQQEFMLGATERVPVSVSMSTR